MKAFQFSLLASPLLGNISFVVIFVGGMVSSLLLFFSLVT